MNLRKFYFISSLIISIFLFLIGVGILSYLGYDSTSASNDVTDDYLDDILDPFKNEKEPINILVLGGDRTSGNTDTMLLVNLNQETAKVNVLSIPRDTMVYIKGVDAPKINGAFPVGGEKYAVETVSKLFDVNIKYFVYLDTSSFRKIIDNLGGVNYTIPANMDYEDPTQNLYIHLKKGYQKLDGSKAEQFMRFRQPNHFNGEISKHYDGSDLKRIEAQQNFIKEVIRQKVNITFITKLNSLMRIIYSNLETNINMDDALKLAENFTKLSIEDVQMFVVPGESKYVGDYSVFVHDKAQTDVIIKEHFFSKSEYAGGEISKISRPKTNGPSTPTKQKEQPVQNKPKTPEDKDNVNKDNPSNAETGIEGSTKPAP